MSAIYSNPVIIKIRAILRKLGLTKVIARLVPQSSYEERFDEALMTAIEPGFVIWDVGANVGLYTKKFSELVGGNGAIHAFEPSPINFEQLEIAVAGLNNVSVYNCALGNELKRISMIQGEDELGATSRVASNDSGEIEMKTGRHLLKDGIPTPSLVKVDVEGYELEVLDGFLSDEPLPKAVKYFAIEIHFRLLAERGMPNAPKEIEQKLKSNGFDVNWVDSSHILAKRK